MDRRPLMIGSTVSTDTTLPAGSVVVSTWARCLVSGPAATSRPKALEDAAVRGKKVVPVPVGDWMSVLPEAEDYQSRPKGHLVLLIGRRSVLRLQVADHIHLAGAVSSRSLEPGLERGPSGRAGAREGTDARFLCNMHGERWIHGSNLRCLNRPTPRRM